MKNPLLAQLRDIGSMGPLMRGNPDEGPLIGASPPAGRGMLITRRAGAQLVGARRQSRGRNRIAGHGGRQSTGDVSILGTRRRRYEAGR